MIKLQYSGFILIAYTTQYCCSVLAMVQFSDSGYLTVELGVEEIA